MRRGYKPPTLVNYAVKFYPDALVMLWSREAAPSSGTHGVPEVGEGGRKMSLVAPGEDRVTALMGEINSEPCFPFLFSVTPLTKEKGS